MFAQRGLQTPAAPTANWRVTWIANRGMEISTEIIRDGDAASENTPLY